MRVSSIVLFVGAIMGTLPIFVNGVEVKSNWGSAALRGGVTAKIANATNRVKTAMSNKGKKLDEGIVKFEKDNFEAWEKYAKSAKEAMNNSHLRDHATKKLNGMKESGMKGVEGIRRYFADGGYKAHTKTAANLLDDFKEFSLHFYQQLSGNGIVDNSNESAEGKIQEGAIAEIQQAQDIMGQATRGELRRAADRVSTAQGLGKTPAEFKADEPKVNTSFGGGIMSGTTPNGGSVSTFLAALALAGVADRLKQYPVVTPSGAIVQSLPGNVHQGPNGFVQDPDRVMVYGAPKTEKDIPEINKIGVRSDEIESGQILNNRLEFNTWVASKQTQVQWWGLNANDRFLAMRKLYPTLMFLPGVHTEDVRQFLSSSLFQYILFSPATKVAADDAGGRKNTVGKFYGKYVGSGSENAKAQFLIRLPDLLVKLHHGSPNANQISGRGDEMVQDDIDRDGIYTKAKNTIGNAWYLEIMLLQEDHDSGEWRPVYSSDDAPEVQSELDKFNENLELARQGQEMLNQQAKKEAERRLAEQNAAKTFADSAQATGEAMSKNIANAMDLAGKSFETGKNIFNAFSAAREHVRGKRADRAAKKQVSNPTEPESSHQEEGEEESELSTPKKAAFLQLTNTNADYNGDYNPEESAKTEDKSAPMSRAEPLLQKLELVMSRTSQIRTKSIYSPAASFLQSSMGEMIGSMKRDDQPQENRRWKVTLSIGNGIYFEYLFKIASVEFSVQFRKDETNGPETISGDFSYIRNAQNAAEEAEHRQTSVTTKLARIVYRNDEMPELARRSWDTWR